MRKIRVGFVCASGMEEKTRGIASDPAIAPRIGNLAEVLGFAPQVVVLIGRDEWVRQHLVAARTLREGITWLVCRQSANWRGACELLEAGADCCLPARCAAEEVGATIRALARRQRLDDGTDFDVHLDSSSRTLLIHSSKFRFGPTAFQVVRYLVEHRDCWVSQRELVELAIGARFYPDCSVARVHVHQIRRRLGPYAPCIPRERGNGGGYLFSLTAAADQ